jgi:methylenetetrahydrofolate reductase (NADPH)
MHLKNLLGSKKFAILAEIEPPKGVNVSAMVNNALQVKGKVDAFVVPEMSNAVMRMSSLGGAVVLQKKALEAVIQLNCRDRNRIALQADLLAAYACGIQTVMAVTGEDPAAGDHPQARAVYDLDVLELLGAIRTLQGGRDMAGIELDDRPEFLVGTTVNAGAKDKDLDVELEAMDRKIEAGAQFFVIPPVFDPTAIESFLKRIDLGKTHIIATVMLLKSVGMARYIQRHLSHIHIPDLLVQRLQKSPDKVRECIRMAAEVADALKQQGFSGVLFATLGWEKKLPEVLSSMGR